MIFDCFISMYFNFYMSIRLSWKCSRLYKLTILALSYGFLSVCTPFLFLFMLLIVTNIKSLSPKVIPILTNSNLCRSWSRNSLSNIGIPRLALIMNIICLCSIRLEFLISPHYLLSLLLIRIIKVIWCDCKFAPILTVLLYIVLYYWSVLVFVVWSLPLKLRSIIGVCCSIYTCNTTFLIKGGIANVFPTILSNILCSLSIGTNIGILSI